MVEHQTVKPAVPSSNPASLQPAGTCHSLLGSQQGWHDNCRLASKGRQRQKNTKIQKNNKKKMFICTYKDVHLLKKLGIFIHINMPLYTKKFPSARKWVTPIFITNIAGTLREALSYIQEISSNVWV